MVYRQINLEIGDGKSFLRLETESWDVDEDEGDEWELEYRDIVLAQSTQYIQARIVKIWKRVTQPMKVYIIGFVTQNPSDGGGDDDPASFG